jgi:hypothetical protein
MKVMQTLCAKSWRQRHNTANGNDLFMRLYGILADRIGAWIYTLNWPASTRILRWRIG